MSAPHMTLYTKGPKELVTTRGDGYKTKANGVGYSGWKRQVHHILPCASLNRSKEAFIALEKNDPGALRLGLERIVKYNVNEAPNLIGLPSSRVYAKKYCRPFDVKPKTVVAPISAAKDPLVASCNWPIHLWNHPEYNDFAQMQTDGVWDYLKMKIVKHKPVEAQDVGDMIRAVSETLKLDLENPAGKLKRTQNAWQDGEKTAFDII